MHQSALPTKSKLNFIRNERKRIEDRCSSEMYCINVKIIMSENDPDNLSLYEAFYIRKCKPTLNSREECTEFADLLF